MEQKLRYKMKKVKKHWVTVAIASTMAAFIGTASPVSAETQTVEGPAAGTQTATNPEQAVKEPAAAEVQTADQEQAADNGITAVPEQAEAAAALPDQTADNAVVQENSDQNSTPANQAAAQVKAAEVPADRQVDAAQTEDLQDVAASLPDNPNVKQIDGKYFYIGADGQPKKNYTLTVGNQTYYFDKETGALANADEYEFQEGLTSMVNDYTEHNQIANTDAKSLETVDNYITADSWYRPKDILQNGTTWTASAETDLRPLLMAWWPDKQTQIAYLNHMNAEGLGTGTVYTSNDTQAALNLAAQEVQRKIETRIAQEKGTDWLRASISKFVKTQPNWNIASESETVGTNKDHLQGGALMYSNNALTPNANSDYRLINRTPTNQTGQQKYFADSDPVGGYEFLLANDIDNSHPAVQAEQLNWLHYLMNYGSIVANDPAANFDGVRIDAVDNVNADLLQIASDYFKSYYGVEKSEADAIAHLSILEAWSHNDPYYNRDTDGAQLPIDNYLRFSLLYTLMRPLEQRSKLEDAITNSLNNRSAEAKHSERMANYVFVRAHDSEVQTVIAKIIRENINPKTDGFTFTLDELKQAFAIYNQDMRQADKKYTQFNIPAAYALMLSNKDTITRVYYGDLYTDDGQYMETKSPYYDALDTLMRARYRYVAGGQDMAVVRPEGATSSSDYSDTAVLTSVRYGTGANEASDQGTAETRTQGMAVITSNNPGLKLGADDKVRVNMGAAHKNQAYRPLLLTNKDGLATYLTDGDTPDNLIRYTDADGYLTFDADDIAGYSNVQVSGYLAVWVPVGAPADQDVRVAPSDQPNASGKVYESTAALDSQLMYEGFSNFQDFAQTDSQYTNKKIAENVDLFEDWGVTSFEIAPQYVSSEDGSFLDAIILNGYAFEDRYDLAMSKNNKYGSQEDLLNALRALHSKNIQVIADWVPDQIYNLPGQEVVTATRVNNYGKYRDNSELDKLLYVANTKSYGGDYQAQYGGAFLDELKANHPEIFERVQISNGQKMDADTKIKEWKAEYFNGTNILGRGARYVLSDYANQEYFSLNGDQAILPRQLTNQEARTGFVNDGKGMTFYSTSGSQAKEAFIQDAQGNWYYFDKDGHMVSGQQEINGDTYYFLPNGVQLRDAILENSDGTKNYFGHLGKRYSGDYYSFDNADGTTNWRYFDDKGVMAVGLKSINGNTQYFDDNGIQVKGQWVTAEDGKKRFFEHNSGIMAINRFADDEAGNWYYIGSDGTVLTGLQTIGGNTYHFAADGKQTKGQFVTLDNGNRVYFDDRSGLLVTNKFKEVAPNQWYYFGNTGSATTGNMTINGQRLFFDDNGLQAKGRFVIDDNGRRRYYHPDSGELQTSRFEADSDGSWFYLGSDGVAVTGSQTIDNQKLFFAQDGKQIKGDVATDESNILRYYDRESGSMVYSQTVTLSNGKRIVIDDQGAAQYI